MIFFFASKVKQFFFASRDHRYPSIHDAFRAPLLNPMWWSVLVWRTSSLLFFVIFDVIFEITFNKKHRLITLNSCLIFYFWMEFYKMQAFKKKIHETTQFKPTDWSGSFKVWKETRKRKYIKFSVWSSFFLFILIKNNGAIILIFPLNFILRKFELFINWTCEVHYRKKSLHIST